MGRNKERNDIFKYQEAAWISSLGGNSTQNPPDSRAPNIDKFTNKIVYTSVTPNREKPFELELKKIMEEPPTPVKQEDFKASLEDSADECYCSNSGPKSKCCNLEEQTPDIDNHLNTVKISANRTKFN